jgi:hypothetical protein
VKGARGTPKRFTPRTGVAAGHVFASQTLNVRERYAREKALRAQLKATEPKVA